MNLPHAIRALLRRGPHFVWVYVHDALMFDWIHGTHTHLRVPKQEFEGAERERNDGLLYVASLTSVVRETVGRARVHLGEEAFRSTQFVDLGCGKGKTLLVYALEFTGQPQAVGIEYDEELCQVARQNANRLPAIADRVRIVCDSALNLDAHVHEGFLLVYIYNSFQGETLEGVLDRLADRPHVMIYVDPAERFRLHGRGYQVIEERAGRYNADTWLIAVLR